MANALRRVKAEKVAVVVSREELGREIDARFESFVQLVRERQQEARSSLQADVAKRVEDLEAVEKRLRDTRVVGEMGWLLGRKLEVGRSATSILLETGVKEAVKKSGDEEERLVFVVGASGMGLREQESDIKSLKEVLKQVGQLSSH
jgi:hypothetical protein